MQTTKQLATINYTRTMAIGKYKVFYKIEAMGLSPNYIKQIANAYSDNFITITPVNINNSLTNTFLNVNSLNVSNQIISDSLTTINDIMVGGNITSTNSTIQNDETVNGNVYYSTNTQIYKNQIYQSQIRSSFKFFTNLSIVHVGGVTCTSVSRIGNGIYQCYMTLPANYNITGSANRYDNISGDMDICPYNMTTTSFKLKMLPNNDLNTNGWCSVNIIW